MLSIIPVPAVHVTAGAPTLLPDAAKALSNKASHLSRQPTCETEAGGVSIGMLVPNGTCLLARHCAVLYCLAVVRH